MTCPTILHRSVPLFLSYVNHDRVIWNRDELVTLFFEEPFMQAIQTNCPWLLRYLVTAIILTKVIDGMTGQWPRSYFFVVAFQELPFHIVRIPWYIDVRILNDESVDLHTLNPPKRSGGSADGIPSAYPRGPHRLVPRHVPPELLSRSPRFRDPIA